ncbi:ATP-binding cassette domain-containing protein [uncultured Phycicoccus sp.]|uniref:ATP-binding cassette domain-containing protein n=1 Tax=uncultured Phycicoccus sp. TaxID=661422 RepID=UPI0026084FE0|nr:ABC transporter ATP-binding protein [uncultured Phycicoccus sp.]
MTIELDHVSARRSRTLVLEDVSAVLDEPVTTVMGPNGAGKTTLLQVLAGLVRHTGEIRWEGQVLRHPRDLARIGYAPQTIIWPARLTPREVCGVAAHLRGVDADAVAARVTTALEAAGLTEVADRRAGRLSGGQRRRLTLAQSLVHAPDLLLLDEPTSELDPLFCDAFVDTLTALSARHRVVITTHSIDDVARWPGGVILLGPKGVATVENAAAMSADARADAVRSAFRMLTV